MTLRPDVPPDRSSSAADCRACGRFMGPAMECPYCGADAIGRGAVRALRWAAAVFGIGGLAILFWVSRHTELPLVRAAAVGPAMHHGQVRVRGTVVSAPRVFDRQGQPDYASFEIDDGSGRIIVAATRQTARAVVTAGSLPAKGDAVEASGNLTVLPQQRPRLYLESPTGLKRLASSLRPETGARPAASGLSPEATPEGT